MPTLLHINLAVSSIFVIIMSIIQTCTISALGILFYLRILKAKNSLQMAGKLVKDSMEPLFHTYTPIYVCILILRKYYKVDTIVGVIEDVKGIYRDAELDRGAFVLHVFGKDELSDEFIEKYQSRFIKYGFDGEQAFLHEPLK